MKVHYLRMVRRAFRALRHKKLRHRPWWQKISKPLFHRSLWVPCRDTVASGLAIGLFLSMIPFIPQSIFAAVLAMRVRVNVPFAMAACFISNPFTNLPFWAAQVKLGKWLIDTLSLPVPSFFATAIELPTNLAWLPGFDEFDAFVKSAHVSINNFTVGFVGLGTLMALAAYPIVHLFAAILPKHLPVRKRGIKVVPAAQSDGS